MELRELKYFLAVAKEESISKAAETLFITQPNLSRQMQNLEKELRQKLFVRGTRKITLTEAGRLLCKRAEEIIELYEKTETELSTPVTDVSGDIYIGGGESYAMEIVAKVAREVQAEYPKVKFHIFSGDGPGIAERLDKGLIDFGVFIGVDDLSKYEHLRLPLFDTWGVLMRKDDPLAEKESVINEDLWDKPLLLSRQSLGENVVTDWLGKSLDKLNVAGSGNLIYNLSLMVKEGVGIAITLNKLINVTGDSELCFKPLFPQLISHLDVAWKKYQVFPKCTEIFLNRLKETLRNV